MRANKATEHWYSDRDAMLEVKDNGENSTREGKGGANIKQPHLKYTCQRAVIVKAPPAVLCTLPDPRPVKYAMLDQKGVFLCPTPDSRSVKPPSQCRHPRSHNLTSTTVPAFIHTHDTVCYLIPIAVQAPCPYR